MNKFVVQIEKTNGFFSPVNAVIIAEKAFSFTGTIEVIDIRGIGPNKLGVTLKNDIELTKVREILSQAFKYPVTISKMS